jgi:3-dehydroquinate synthase II
VKSIWIKAIPWNKELAIAALEGGADGVVLAEGDAARMRELGRMTVVAPDGDIRPERDLVEIAVTGKADEEAAAAAPRDKILLLTMTDWTVIPLENLIARRDKLMVTVADAEAARTAVGILEKGVDGVVLETPDPNEVRQAIKIVKGIGEAVDLELATVTEVRPLGMGDRVCIDTCTQMRVGQGMLIGNTTEGFLLVHSETIENPYVAARPFRVNAGAVHAYCVVPGGQTRYLSELAMGDPVLLVDAGGATEVGYVGRCKVEKRPMLLVRAEVVGRPVSLVLQNAETIRLTQPEGRSVSVAALEKGDEVLAHLMGGGRHFGMKIDESLDER